MTIEQAKSTLHAFNYCEVHLVPLKHLGANLICTECRQEQHMKNLVKISEAINVIKKYKADSSGN